MESFPAVASRVLQEFRALLQHSPSPLGSTRMLQIITINMFTIHYAQIRGKDSTLSVAVDPVWSIEKNLSCFSLCCASHSFSLSLAEGQGETRSVLEEQTISLGLAMFGLLVQRCTELLKETPAGESTMAVSLMCCLHRQHKVTLSICDSYAALSNCLLPFCLCQSLSQQKSWGSLMKWTMRRGWCGCLSSLLTSESCCPA